MSKKIKIALITEEEQTIVALNNTQKNKKRKIYRLSSYRNWLTLIKREW